MFSKTTDSQTENRNFPKLFNIVSRNPATAEKRIFQKLLEGKNNSKKYLQSGFDCAIIYSESKQHTQKEGSKYHEEF